MQNFKFYRFGKFIYKMRWPVIIIWVLIIVSCIPFLPHIITPFKTTGFIDENSSSATAEEYIDKELGYDNKNKFLIIYHSPKLLAKNPLFLKKIKRSLTELKNFPLKHEIIFPDKKKQISKDKHTAYVVVIIKTNKPIPDKLFEQFKASIKTPSNMTVQTGGEQFFIESVTKQTQTDLFKADIIAAPVAIITMLLVFGSVIAAFLPIVLGGGCALIILTALFMLGHLFTLSIFTLNIALLLGLCLSLDYSLFIISRFRDELDNGLNTIEAIAITQEHAGKAIFFSGLAVFVSLSALFLFPINILFSVAVGGLIAVFVAMLIAIILLPSILCVLDKKINLLSIRSLGKDKNNRAGSWHWIAEKVVNRPLLFFLSVLIFLLLLGYPFLSATFGVSDYKIFPENSEGREFYDTYSEKFNINELTPILLVVKSKKGPILSRKNLYDLYNLTQNLKKNPLIKKVDSIVTTNPDLTKKQYYTLYHTQQSLNKATIKKLLSTTTHKQVTVLSVVSKYPMHSAQTDQLITDLHKIKMSPGLSMQITGKPVSNKEVLERIYEILPYAILWIMVFSYLILLLLLRSLFLPFKAILMNLLSLCACYGALVLVFQDGYLSNLFNFQPQGLLDISLLVIIFCALFGFSMDYEVFLLSRIKESYELSGDNRNSIIFGIEKSSRIITSAAIIVIVLCGSFLVADVLMVKAFGLGIAVAIFVDAFLIRTLLVPATMSLLESWNWYLPKWLDKILPKF
ncbi:membrane protein [Legionella antarctica]|uniref:Membrane protein n=1 Tax=Legionella antarctica TaxID=2708020 RepID=A0A6F8T3T3_9GAMM|nr:MMPL family transporter [Legionella antarctica]BCA95058.1 membrane protein [Legionella antarctica]